MQCQAICHNPRIPCLSRFNHAGFKLQQPGPVALTSSSQPQHFDQLPQSPHWLTWNTETGAMRPSLLPHHTAIYRPCTRLELALCFRGQAPDSASNLTVPFPHILWPVHGFGALHWASGQQGERRFLDIFPAWVLPDPTGMGDSIGSISLYHSSH